MSLSQAALDQLKILTEGAVDVISEQEFGLLIEQSLQKNKPLRIKYGADPSSPDLHLGHTVALRKLSQFQDYGHTVVFIIGDFTAMIGDPSHRSQTRKMLSADEVKQNAATYQEQVFKILDKNKTEVRYNSEWLSKMTAADFLHLTSQYTVARLLERDDFQKRFTSKTPIAVVELMYPLLQGYDSVKVESDLEIGGTDQKFNLLVGRELQKVWNQKPQSVLTFPLIEGLDGVQKMSKSLNNHIALMDCPREMFGKVMSLPDVLMERYYRYVSGLSSVEVTRIAQQIKSGELHPREAKAKLGEQIVSLYHSKEKGEEARREFDQIFRDKGLPDEIQTFSFAQQEIDIVSLLKEMNLVPSKSEARRMIEQGGVKVDQIKVTDTARVLSLKNPILIQCGKRKFAKVQYAGK
ncbi:MAG: tyrosine--tRNA ligase [Candidatus Omnitrophica bacterium]|nr:tyrosine--tRNA ligase [Candidatus Omnitrophota bacterium]